MKIASFLSSLLTCFAFYGMATPMSYEVNGKQYVVIAAGGHGKLATKLGDAVVAYAVEE